MSLACLPMRQFVRPSVCPSIRNIFSLMITIMNPMDQIETLNENLSCFFGVVEFKMAA